jgi:hypothetical protein
VKVRLPNSDFLFGQLGRKHGERRWKKRSFAVRRKGWRAGVANPPDATTNNFQRIRSMP